MTAANLGKFYSTQSNVRLESSTKKTNDFGVAYFALRVLEGKEGVYMLKITGEGCSPLYTSPFKLANSIANIYYLQDGKQHIEVYIFIYNYKNFNLSRQSSLIILKFQLFYQSNQ